MQWTWSCNFMSDDNSKKYFHWALSVLCYKLYVDCLWIAWVTNYHEKCVFQNETNKLLLLRIVASASSLIMVKNIADSNICFYIKIRWVVCAEVYLLSYTKWYVGYRKMITNKETWLVLFVHGAYVPCKQCIRRDDFSDSWLLLK